ncbi:MAG: archease [Desulfobacterales bacterium]|nr:archease [Desulfobacterales bacterium]
MNYTLIDHTADLGIRVEGADPRDLFQAMAMAMLDQLTELEALEGVDEIEFTVDGEDWPDLMVNWLREILYLWFGEEKLVKKVEVLSISEHRMSVRVAADPYDPEKHTIKKEIKAATYHQLQVNEGPSGWKAAVIFDL